MGLRAAAIVIVGLASLAGAQTCTPWTQTATTGPSIRSGQAMAFDETRQQLVLFGGYGPKPDGTEYPGDTWGFNGSTWTQLASTGPQGFEGTSLAYDAARHNVVMFGGVRYSSELPAFNGATWVWNGTAWSQSATSGPPARYLAGMAYDRQRQQTILFGGASDINFRDTFTWAWDGTTWTAVANSGPALRFGHAMAYDAGHNVIFLFGGFGGAGAQKEVLGDTWVWDGTRWSQVSSVGPSPRMYASMVFDYTRGNIVLFGGRTPDGRALSDLWEWEAGYWQRVDDVPAVARESASMSFDTVRNKLVLFGGFGPRGRFGDTWQRRIGGTFPIITLAPHDTRVAPGATAMLSTQVAGAGPFTYQWRRNDVVVLDGARVSGATTMQLSIAGAQLSDAGSYTVRVSNGCGEVTSTPAVLKVRCPADIDDGTMTGTSDNAVTIEDLIAFLAFFEAGDIRADIDDGSFTGLSDGAVEVADLLFFLARFERGC